MYERRDSLPVKVGNQTIGGPAPIAVQCMTDTDTADIQATVRQIFECVNAGAELVRVTINTEQAAKALPCIRNQLDEKGYHISFNRRFSL